MFSKLTEEQVRQVFSDIGLPTADAISKIEIGYSSDVFSIGDRYIFKSAKSEEDNESLEREIFVCNLLKGIVPAPEIIHADTGKSQLDRNFFIYKKIQGENLYHTWHQYSALQRKEIVHEVCAFLRAINNVPFNGFATKFGIDVSVPWSQKILSMIREEKQKILSKGALSNDLDERIETYIRGNSSVLDESVLALTYFDAHFDNFLVNAGKVVGMLDFERTGILSIDYALYVPQLMVNKPTKYPSKESEKFIRPEDYTDLMTWYEEYYPELFRFSHMNTRLNFYLIHHCLEDLFWWPDHQGLKEDLRRYSAYTQRS